MAKKKVFGTVVGLAALAAAGKFGYDKYKKTKDDFEKEEADSSNDSIRKYNSIFDSKVVEVEDEDFQGCELQTIGSKFVLDLGLAKFDRDVYVSLNAKCSSVTIIVPENISAVADIKATAGFVHNYAQEPENKEEEVSVYVVGDAVASTVEIIPMNFYLDEELGDEDFEDELDGEDDFENEEITIEAADEEPAAKAAEESVKED